MKGGLGTASYKVPGTEIVVGAIVAVNAVGDVRAPNSHRILAGARTEDGKGFRNTMAAIMQGHGVVKSGGANTTIGAIATNAPFGKTELKKIAGMAHDALPAPSTRSTQCGTAIRSLRFPPARRRMGKLM
ncbi:peptidase S58 DmpA [Brucella ceti TE28753-12]|nr:peptidase S58 DmpA [Brucella ceti TE28753-12]